jgi:hypothetical protein
VSAGTQERREGTRARVTMMFAVPAVLSLLSQNALLSLDHQATRVRGNQQQTEGT